MPELNYLRDPTSEAATTIRPTRPFPLAIARERQSPFWIFPRSEAREFLDRMALNLSDAGYPVKRYRKGSHSKTAAPEITETIVREADFVIESLAD